MSVGVCRQSPHKWLLLNLRSNYWRHFIEQHLISCSLPSIATVMEILLWLQSRYLHGAIFFVDGMRHVTVNSIQGEEVDCEMVSLLKSPITSDHVLNLNTDSGSLKHFFYKLVLLLSVLKRNHKHTTCCWIPAPTVVLLEFGLFSKGSPAVQLISYYMFLAFNCKW